MRRILSACEKISKKKKRQESCDLSFFNSMELLLECAFMPLSAIMDRSEFTLDYLSQLGIAICLDDLEKYVFWGYNFFAMC